MLARNHLVHALEALLDNYTTEMQYIFDSDTITAHDVAEQAITDEVVDFVNEGLRQIPIVESDLTSIASEVWDKYQHICHDKTQFVPMLAKRRMFHIDTTFDLNSVVDDFMYGIGTSLYLDEYGNFITTNDVIYTMVDTRQTIHKVTSWNADPRELGFAPSTLAEVLDERVNVIFD